MASKAMAFQRSTPTSSRTPLPHSSRTSSPHSSRTLLVAPPPQLSSMRGLSPTPALDALRAAGATQSAPTSSEPSRRVRGQTQQPAAKRRRMDPGRDHHLARRRRRSLTCGASASLRPWMPCWQQLGACRLQPLRLRLAQGLCRRTPRRPSGDDRRNRHCQVVEPTDRQSATDLRVPNHGDELVEPGEGPPA